MKTHEGVRVAGRLWRFWEYVTSRSIRWEELRVRAIEADAGEMGRNTKGLCLRVIKKRWLSPPCHHRLSMKIWKSLYACALRSSTQEQSKEISHQAFISGGHWISWLVLSLQGKLIGETFGVFTVCSSFTLLFKSSDRHWPGQRLQESFLRLELNMLLYIPGNNNRRLVNNTNI